MCVYVCVCVCVCVWHAPPGTRLVFDERTHYAKERRMAGFAAHGGKVSAGEASGRVRHLWMRNRPRGEPQMSSGLKIDIDWFGEPILPVNHRLKKNRALYLYQASAVHVDRWGSELLACSPKNWSSVNHSSKSIFNNEIVTWTIYSFCKLSDYFWSFNIKFWMMVGGDSSWV